MTAFWLTVIVANAFTVTGWVIDEAWPFIVAVTLSVAALVFLLFGGLS